MANLLVEIGNTALKAAWSEGTTLGKTYRYQGEKKMEFLLSLTKEDKPEVLAIATADSVSPAEEEMLRVECGHLLVLDKNRKETLLKYDLPEYLSYDRAACVLATTFLFKDKPCTVFDFGTTLNVEFVSVTGKYLGGNISPGCRTRFKSLERYSRALPLVDTPDETEPEGHSLKSSIGSGVISGIMFEIEGYARLRPDNTLVFTGGDAAYFAKRMKNSIFVIPNLMMMGLAIIADDHVKKHIQ